MLDKKALITALTMLSISFNKKAGEEKLTQKLTDGLQEKLTTLGIEYPGSTDINELLDLYTLATAGSKDNEEEYQAFRAKVGFSQPWQGGTFSKDKNETFDCDDDKLIAHLQSNSLITSQ